MYTYNSWKNMSRLPVRFYFNTATSKLSFGDQDMYYTNIFNNVGSLSQNCMYCCIKH